MFKALYSGNNAGIDNKKVTAPAPSNCANIPINAVTIQTMTTLPRVINISRLTIGLNRPLSVIMPKNIIAKINMMTTLITDSKPLLKNLTKSLMPYPNSKAPILELKSYQRPD